ncbi:group 3 secretory phospholipase A2-like [Crassostrea angulata]|uniref:group 3 secretory phospholipase A2-like n=1 Tax=Magallana angulata TaxID=2784310 RepID=UPI0022B14D42|nr:group 3 secretory phospholipase A2-like [Crassostrea angulata]
MKLLLVLFVSVFVCLVCGKKEHKKQDPPYKGNLTLFLRSHDMVYTFKVRGRTIKLQRPILNLKEKYENERKKAGKEKSLRSILSDKELKELKNLIQAPHAINLRDYNVIYPGTKWCGTGNDATNYEDLGTAEDVDMCCREHDLCDFKIDAGQSNYGLTNDGSYTRVSCDCEQTFYDCLSNAQENSFDAAMIGFIYFDVLDQDCIRKRRICTGYSWWGNCNSWTEVADEYEFAPNELDYIW